MPGCLEIRCAEDSGNVGPVASEDISLATRLGRAHVHPCSFLDLDCSIFHTFIGVKRCSQNMKQ